MKIRTQLFLVFGLLTAALFLTSGVIVLFSLKHNLTQTTEKELSNTVSMVKSQIDITIDASVRNHMKAVAEKIRGLADYLDNEVRNKRMTYSEARATYRGIILNPSFGKIGHTGYLCTLTMDGKTKIHPYVEGMDVSEMEFYKEAKALNEGYLEYEWKNPGETEYRKKAGYVMPFPTWNEYIWVSAYLSEVVDLVNMNKIAHDQFRDQILSVTIGETGYIFILDSKGNVIIHPSREGKNDYNQTDASGRAFIKEICEKKNGVIEYSWQNPGEARPRGKILRFQYIPQMDWIIAAGSYTEEIFKVYYDIRTILLIALSSATLILLLVTFIYSRGLNRQLERMTKLAENFALGDLSYTKIALKRKDEIGKLSRAFQTMRDALAEKEQILSKIANKDLTVDIIPSSDKDQLGISLSSMKNSLREILTQVNAAVTQVSAGADQISQSGQTLSQGTTEQAAALQEMSASLSEITSRSDTNAEDAERASGLARKSTSDADMGKTHMNDLTQAMERINASSKEIQTVIKVIDDIAFQINLLALNANIEAARAGKYGKGFAVVANEVRNLAVKSATSVKETTDIVDTTLNNIQDGNLMVEKTAGQLTEIVQGSAAVAEVLDGLSRSSVEQASALREIAQGMGQIDQVTQGNAASAEESASASEELAGQSQQLEQLVRKFKL